MKEDKPFSSRKNKQLLTRFESDPHSKWKMLGVVRISGSSGRKTKSTASLLWPSATPWNEDRAGGVMAAPRGLSSAIPSSKSTLEGQSRNEFARGTQRGLEQVPEGISKQLFQHPQPSPLGSLARTQLPLERCSRDNEARGPLLSDHPVKSFLYYETGTVLQNGDLIVSSSLISAVVQLMDTDKAKDLKVRSIWA
ncbi:hypothetical protein Y1Q_0023668 [Alligator mississippiensis]|uniref:Uncharacterized protein n=1 Tax=Alligator mississippiensis TaxID=8496 RepID=A0A151NBR1_ALLMI|nr:hypothetical protein Y1Q_0023668 [Alligator mississippiensis]